MLRCSFGAKMAVLSQTEIALFSLLLARAVFAAYFSNISDCDEVYNYWEPVGAKPSPPSQLLLMADRIDPLLAAWLWNANVGV